MQETVHASCVFLGQSAILVTGRSGAGKSSLCLELMAMGAVLVSDDQTVLTRSGDRLMADAPPQIRGQIEARGIGILRASAAGPCNIGLVVDLDLHEENRLPDARHRTLLGITVPLVAGPMRCGLAAALRQMALCGRIA